MPIYVMRFVLNGWIDVNRTINSGIRMIEDLYGIGWSFGVLLAMVDMVL